MKTLYVAKQGTLILAYEESLQEARSYFPASTGWYLKDIDAQKVEHYRNGYNEGTVEPLIMDDGPGFKLYELPTLDSIHNEGLIF
jgi:hypothetical protein